MAISNRRLILGNGEKYIEPALKNKQGRPAPLPRTYSAAREHVRDELFGAIEAFSELESDKRLGNEAIFCLRLHPDFTAKTYSPTTIFQVVPDLVNVGSRAYTIPANAVAKTKRLIKRCEDEKTDIVSARLVFVRSEIDGFQRLIRKLDAAESSLHKDFRKEICQIERFDLLRPSERLLGFPDSWEEGRVELVFHPSRHRADDDDQLNFISELLEEHGAGERKHSLSPYPDGPTFVSCRLRRSALDEISSANPLRNAHPLVFSGLPKLRTGVNYPAPPPPTLKSRSTINVGIFDGGVEATLPHLKGYVEEDSALSITTPKDPDCVAHGSAVAGVVLYGALNGKSLSEPLPEPPVSVVSIRALPTSDPSDCDLHESIDVIEAAVPARPDVKIWNVSFGPVGPIMEDSVSRFTYALDRLSSAHKVTFSVAVGNHGHYGDGLDGIQAPSDLVNGLGVGAFSYRSGGKAHAPYSCRGPGRECAKLKPDVVAFGGCDETPIHLLSLQPNRKITEAGTSFASPQVACIAARSMALMERGTPLLSRALLVHTADHPEGSYDRLIGHGIAREDIDEILRCKDNEVTIIFQDELIAKRHVKLPLMLPPEAVDSGMIEVVWTIAILPAVSAHHPSDYTNACIEDKFYPNDQIYGFTKKDASETEKPTKLHLIDDAKEIAELEREGWKRSLLPVAKSLHGNLGGNGNEERLRALDLKWEPVVRKRARMQAGKLLRPFFVLRPIPRHNMSGQLDFAAAITIRAPHFTGDLYTSVLRAYPALQPVRVQAEPRIRI